MRNISVTVYILYTLIIVSDYFLRSHYERAFEQNFSSQVIHVKLCFVSKGYYIPL